MVDNTNNKVFWNNYVTYWENKVNEANNDKMAVDKTPDDTILEEFFGAMNIQQGENVLDYGCGFCRLYPIWTKHGEGYNSGRYYGIDVSNVMLDHAKVKYKELEINKTLFEFDGLHIPFEDDYFDNIVCFAVFDAVNQKEVMKELLRVLKIGGKLLITGKNTKYFADDNDAYVAEVNARKKEHPNSFTNAHMLKELLLQHVTFIEERYFLYRRDCAMNKYEKEMPNNFYQWGWIIKKCKDIGNLEFPQFSDVFSKVFMEKEGVSGEK